jgi:type IV pilus assembly protein PilV
MSSSTHPCQSGFALVEVLISILVLSVGMIGAIKMQTNALQTTQHSHYFNVALQLATEMADEMRSNDDQMRLSEANPFLQVAFQAGKEAIKATTLCFDINCTPDQLAASDIAEWLQDLNAALPNVRAVICLDDTAWDSVQHDLIWGCSALGNQASAVIKLGWTEKDEASPDSPPRLVIPVVPHIIN